MMDGGMMGLKNEVGFEVDDYFRKIKAAGAKPASEPGDRMYGMRDFVVCDSDGNQLSFGCDNEKE